MTLQELTAQTPIGECFNWEGDVFEVRPTHEIIDPFCIGGNDLCEHCYFKSLRCGKICCFPSQRKDGRHVYFIKQNAHITSDKI